MGTVVVLLLVAGARDYIIYVHVNNKIMYMYILNEVDITAVDVLSAQVIDAKGSTVP